MVTTFFFYFLFGSKKTYIIGGFMRTITFVHTADLHLGGPIKGWKWDKNEVWRRYEEHLNTFQRIIDRVESEEIPFLFIAGDFLEHGYVTSTLFQFVIDQLNRIPNTHILISPGNHDPYRIDSVYVQKEWPSHVHIFGSSWEEKCYTEFDLQIFGRGFADFIDQQSSLPDKKEDDKARYQIYLMHGDYRSNSSPYFPIIESALLTHQVDYVALGHIHHRETFRIGQGKHTIIHYPGSPEAHNWKESGGRSVTVGSIDERGVHLKHVPIHTRAYELVEADVTGYSRPEEVTKLIVESFGQILSKNYGFIRFTGCSSMKIDDPHWYRSVESELVNKYKWIAITDDTTPEYDLDSLRSQDQLIGTFIELLEEKLAKEQDQNNQKIIQLALDKGLDAYWKVTGS